MDIFYRKLKSVITDQSSFGPFHTGLHPHQSGGPIPNPALYAAPPVSLSPGQPPPQQLLPPPFYPPPGVMTFSNTNYPYPAGATLPPMYPNAQVTLFSVSPIFAFACIYCYDEAIWTSLTQ